jgi:hypothetical protein
MYIYTEWRSHSVQLICTVTLWCVDRLNYYCLHSPCVCCSHPVRVIVYIHLVMCWLPVLLISTVALFLSSCVLFLYINLDRIAGIMVSGLASSAVDRGFEPRSDLAKDYKIGICWFSAKHSALRRKSKYWLARNQNNVSEWGDLHIRGLLFQWASTIKIWWYSTNRTSSSFHWKLTCSRHDIAHSLTHSLTHARTHARTHSHQPCVLNCTLSVTCTNYCVQS